MALKCSVEVFSKGFSYKSLLAIAILQLHSSQPPILFPSPCQLLDPPLHKLTKVTLHIQSSHGTTYLNLIFQDEYFIIHKLQHLGLRPTLANGKQFPNMSIQLECNKIIMWYTFIQNKEYMQYLTYNTISIQLISYLPTHENKTTDPSSYKISIRQHSMLCSLECGGKQALAVKGDNYTGRRGSIACMCVRVLCARAGVHACMCACAANLHVVGPDLCEQLIAVLAIAIWWRQGRVRSWPCKPTKRLPMHTRHAFRELSSSSGPRYCPWPTSHHIAHIVKISKLLIGYSASCDQMGGLVTCGVVGQDKIKNVTHKLNSHIYSCMYYTTHVPVELQNIYPLEQRRATCAWLPHKYAGRLLVLHCVASASQQQNRLRLLSQEYAPSLENIPNSQLEFLHLHTQHCVSKLVMYIHMDCV